MGGVDLFDQQVAAYRIRINQKNASGHCLRKVSMYRWSMLGDSAEEVVLISDFWTFLEI